MNWFTRPIAYACLIPLLVAAPSARSDELLVDDAGDISIYVIDPLQMSRHTSSETAATTVSEYSGVRIQVVSYPALLKFDALAEGGGGGVCKPYDGGAVHPVIVRRVPGEPDATFFVRSGWVVSFETSKCFRAPPGIARLIRAAESL